MQKVFALALAVTAWLATAAAVPTQISDDVLSERVAAAIVRDPNFTMFDDVEIDVENRVVTLHGRVTQTHKRDALAKTAAQDDGVRSVVNEIGVLPLSPADQELRVRIARAIYNDPAFWRYAQMANRPIHIIVENGRVTLTGVVQSEVERALANSLAQVGGSFGVNNRLRLDRR
jgi:hyperosmotically inducible protein